MVDDYRIKNLGMPRAQLKGQIFGKLVVQEFTGPSSLGEGATWRCLCECGKERIVTTKKLRAGEVKSCGCMNKKPVPPNRWANRTKTNTDHLSRYILSWPINHV